MPKVRYVNRTPTMKKKNSMKNVMDMACPQGPSTGTGLKCISKMKPLFK